MRTYGEKNVTPHHVVFSNWLGLFSKQGYLDTGALGDLTLSIQFQPDSVLSGTTANQINKRFRFENITGNIDTIILDAYLQNLRAQPIQKCKDLVILQMKILMY
jgi:hypothetical protein